MYELMLDFRLAHIWKFGKSISHRTAREYANDFKRGTRFPFYDEWRSLMQTTPGYWKRR